MKPHGALQPPQDPRSQGTFQHGSLLRAPHHQVCSANPVLHLRCDGHITLHCRPSQGYGTGQQPTRTPPMYPVRSALHMASVVFAFLSRCTVTLMTSYRASC